MRCLCFLFSRCSRLLLAHQKKGNLSQIERNEAHKYAQLETKWRITVLVAAGLPNASVHQRVSWKWRKREKIKKLNERKKSVTNSAEKTSVKLYSFLTLHVHS